jgi:hypothetical protein
MDTSSHAFTFCLIVRHGSTVWTVLQSAFLEIAGLDCWQHQWGLRYEYRLQTGRLCGNPVDLGKTAYCDYHVAAEMRNMHSLRGPLLDNNLRIGVAPKRTLAGKGVHKTCTFPSRAPCSDGDGLTAAKQGLGLVLDHLHCASVPGEREEEYLLSIAGS